MAEGCAQVFCGRGLSFSCQEGLFISMLLSLEVMHVRFVCCEWSMAVLLAIGFFHRPINEVLATVSAVTKTVVSAKAYS